MPAPTSVWTAFPDMQDDLRNVLNASYARLVDYCTGLDDSDRESVVKACEEFRRDVNASRWKYDAKTGAYADLLILRSAEQFGVEIPYQLDPPATFNVDDEEEDPLAFY